MHVMKGQGGSGYLVRPCVCVCVCSAWVVSQSSVEFDVLFGRVSVDEFAWVHNVVRVDVLHDGAV